MKVITLMEDTACAPGFACEHGLSFYIETGDKKLLFDMGQTDLFLQNAQTLGVPLDEVDTALSRTGTMTTAAGWRRSGSEPPRAGLSA